MDESKEYFAEVAQEWDAMRSEFFTEEMRDDAIARAKLPQGSVVADVGTGTGFVLSALARDAAHAYGFDESDEMLAVARKNLSGYANVTLERAEGMSMPLADGSLDGVFANMYLHHAEDPPAAIQEMVRMLKPGGVLCITDMDEHDHEEQRSQMADRWLGFKHSDVEQWYASAGLETINIDCAAEDCCAVDPNGDEYALSVFVAIGRKQSEK